MGDLQQTVRELDSNSKVVLKTLSQQVLPIITHHVEHDNAPVQGIHSSFSILSNQLDSMQKNIGKELSMSVVAPTRSTVSTTSGIALIHEGKKWKVLLLTPDDFNHFIYSTKCAEYLPFYRWVEQCLNYLTIWRSFSKWAGRWDYERSFTSSEFRVGKSRWSIRRKNTLMEEEKKNTIVFYYQH